MGSADAEAAVAAAAVAAVEEQDDDEAEVPLALPTLAISWNTSVGRLGPKRCHVSSSSSSALASSFTACPKDAAGSLEP